MKVLITGDFYAGGVVGEMIENGKNPLKSFSEIINRNDYAFTNLECPITTSVKKINKTGPCLKAKPASLNYLKDVGFYGVSLANNHIMDYANEGLQQTIDELDKRDIKRVGADKDFKEASKPIFLTKDGVKVAILNFCENEWSTTFEETPGANPIDPVLAFNAISSVKSVVDQVIVITHSGHEHFQYPTLRGRNLLRFFADAGATAIINHHPHCISGYETYCGVPIFYSIGNFLFENPLLRNAHWNYGMAIELTLSKEKVDFNLVYFKQCHDENATLTLLNGRELDERMKEVAKISNIITNDEQLKLKYNELVSLRAKSYHAYIEPHGIKALTSLQVRGLLPSLWWNRKRKYLLNLIRCESHREILQTILEDDYRNS